MGRLSSRDRSLAHTAGLSTDAVESRNFSLAPVAHEQLFLTSSLPLVPDPGMLTSSSTVYWVYIGYTQKELIIDSIQAVQTVAAGGTVTGAFALGSSDSAPDGQPKAITCTHVASGSMVDDFVGGSVPAMRGTLGTLGWSVSPCTHLWAGCRFGGAGTQPTLLGLALDLSKGRISSGLAVSPLAVGTDYQTAVPAFDVTGAATVPTLRLKLRG